MRPRLQNSAAPLARFCLAPEYIGGALLAAGGRVNAAKRPTINVWDLHRESCVAQLSAASNPAPECAPIDHLAVARSSPVMYAADTSGLVLIYDLRSPAQVGSLQPLKEQRLAGMASEPGRVEHQLVLGYRSGSISFVDCRMVGSRLQSSLHRTIEGHSKGDMTTLSSHRHAPLFATATASQVVKVWSMRGEQVAVVRAHTSFLSQRIGPVTCLAFAPYGLNLCSGGLDKLCAIYSLDLGARVP